MRAVLRSMTWITLFILLAGCATAPKQAATLRPAPLRFIQMTDPQFGMIAKNKDAAKETELFDKAIAAANRLKPAFVVVTGDLTNMGGNPKQIAAFFAGAKKLDPAIPLHLVIGNHDFKSTKGKPTPEALADYRKTFGKDYYSFESGGCLFIALNSCLIQNSETNPAETAAQWEWLKKTLEANPATRPAIVFQHHSWFLKDANEADQYFNLPAKQRAAYLDLMAAHGVKAVFCGHYHRNSEGGYGALPVITTGPVCNPLGKPGETCPPGFRAVTVFPDHVEHKYVGLDETPWPD